MMLRRIGIWLRGLLRRGRAERDLDEELRFHVEREVDRHLGAGVDPAEARRRAHADFGAIESVKQECREARATWALETLLQDLRYGLRVLRRYPLFSATAIVTLALGIGAVSTVLTLAHAFFLRPLPVPGADEIVEVQATRTEGTEPGLVSHPDYVHLRDRTRTLESLAAAYPTAPLFVTLGNDAREVNGAVVSASFFSTLGLRPAAGRFFRADEDSVPGRDRVVVVGHDFWKSWLGGSRDAIGGRIEINGEELTVVGVAPASFPGIDDQPINLYLPTMLLPLGYRWCDDALAVDCTMLRMYGRLGDGVSTEEAAAELPTILPEAWNRAEPGDNSGIRVTPVRGAPLSGADRDFLELLALVGGLLLLVCCANLAGLLLARGDARSSELAIRAALGAPRGRLVRQLLTESLLLAGLGGGAGLAVSSALVALLRRSFFVADSSGRPLQYDFGLVPWVAGLVLVVAMASGVLFGLLPALRSARRAAVEGRSHRVTGAPAGARWLLGAQAAVAVALVVVAALLAASAVRLVQGTNLAPERVALMRLRPRLVGYSPERAQAYLRAVVGRLEALAAVESVSMVGTGVEVVGFDAAVSTAGEEPRSLRTGYIEVGPRYFETLGTPVLRGREFDRGDDAGAARVAVVDATAARRLWPDGDAIGSVLVVEGHEHTVVGVAAAVPLQSRADAPRPYVYVPFWQNPEQVDARLQIRVQGDPEARLPALVREVLTVDPDVPVSETLSLERRLAGWFRPLRLSAAAVSYAGVLAVFLCALGLYASLAASVARRTREIGVRQAVGASSRGVRALITRDGMRVILAGATAGLGLAWVATRLLRHMLRGPVSQDPLFFALAVAVVATVGFVACRLPARRAARIDPMEALRAD